MSNLSKLRGTVNWLPKHIDYILDNWDDFDKQAFRGKLEGINKAIKSALVRINSIFPSFNPVSAVRGQVVRIRWVDAVSIDNWEEDDVKIYGPSKNTTAGIVIHAPCDEHPWWVIAGDVNHHLGVRQASRQMVIPCCQVSDVEILSGIKVKSAAQEDKQ